MASLWAASAGLGLGSGGWRHVSGGGWRPQRPHRVLRDTTGSPPIVTPPFSGDVRLMMIRISSPDFGTWP